MPKISYTQKGGVIRWDSEDWLKGLLPHFVESANTNRILGSGLASGRSIDVFRKPGYIMPGAYPTDPTNIAIIDAFIKNGVVNDNKSYLVSGGAKLHELNLSTFTLTTPTTFPHTIDHSHNNEVGSDIIDYYVSGSKFIFYSFNDGTDGDVGRYDLSTTFDDDYMSTVPTGGAVLDKDYPHTMVTGDDNILYIGNGKDLASFNGSTFNSSALDLPDDYIITSYAKTPTHLVIYAYKGSSVSGGAYYRADSTAFFWNYRSESFDYAYPLSGNYVNGGFIYKGTVGCFVQGRSSDIHNNKYSRMLLFGDNGFEPVIDFYDDIPGHGGVNVEADIIYWNSDGKIYAWGSPFIGFERVLSQSMEFLTGNTSEGMLRNFNGNALIGSAGTTTVGGLQKLTNSGYFTSAQFSTPMTFPQFKEFGKGRVQRVKVFWGEAASGGNQFTLNLQTDRANTTTTIVSGLTTIASPNFITDYTLDTSGSPLPLFESIKLQGAYVSGDSETAVPPYIEAVEVHYENINITQ